MGFTKAQLQGELKRRAQLELQKRHARQYLADFTLYTYPAYLMGWFHKEVCEALDKFLDDVLAKKSPRLILTAPPRHGKSELVSRRFPAFAFGRCPDLQIIATSYGADLAQRFNRDVQRIIDDDTYRTLFPETTLNSRNVKTDSRNAYIRTSDLFEIVNHKGAYRSCGVGGGITGTGADILIIDDPIKDRAEANSPTVRTNVYDWYTSTAYTRLSPGGGVIVMNTRWHPIKDDTPVLTVSGWKQHGELQVGDQVFGLDGKPVAVTKVWPSVMCTAKAVTRTEAIVCGETHLWPVKSFSQNHYANLQACDLIGAVGRYALPVTPCSDSEREVTFSHAEPEECGWGRCITTSAPNGIYLVGRTLMPTHNCFDLAGQLIEKMNAGDGDTWQVINYPAIAEHDEPHRKAGEPLHAERYPLDALNRIRAAVGERDWAALYQQHPVPDGGGLFKEQWLQYYRQADLPSKFDKLVTSWDMTFKDGAGSDYVVGQVWGRAGAKFYLLDQVRGQMDFVKTKAAFVSLAEKWPHAVRKLVEDKANGPAIISELRDKVAGIIPITPKESKEARAYAVSTLWEAHNVYIPDPQETKWVGRDFIPELLSFPAGAHDDQVDAMTQALNDLKVGRMRMDPSNLKYLGF